MTKAKSVRERVASAGWWFSSILTFGILWEALARAGALDSYILPPPSAFLRQLTTLSSFGIGVEQTQQPMIVIVSIVLSSCGRVLAGMVLGLIGALPCGIIMARTAWIEKLIAPAFTLLAPLAPLAWIPLILVLIGVGDIAAVATVFVGVFFLLTLATLNAAKNVDQRYLRLAESLGAGGFSQIVYVIIPSSLPTIFFIMRINFFAAWMAVLTAEGLGITGGLGVLVVMARATANVKLMLAAMFLISFSGAAIDFALRALQERFLSWHTETLRGI